jgi:hypothetical protein
MARGMAILARMWFAVGARSLITSHRDVPEIRNKFDIAALKDAVRNNPDSLMLGSAHPQGGNRMGNNSGCVVDSDCKVHGFDNLYVCDASVFPTALGVNPQLTVMALATITADKIVKNWHDAPVANSLGNTCGLSQPRFCRTDALSDMFAVGEHDSTLFAKLGNSSEERKVGHNWKFDPKTLRIYNDLYWKGFYGRENDAMTMALRYFGGFYKKFWPVDTATFNGITHPFEPQIVDAKSIAKEKVVPGYGQVIHLEYQDFPFSTAYDLLKMVDDNTIIGKAFLGQFGRGRELFSFSMSRVYDVDFMTEDDLATIFASDDLSHIPSAAEMRGIWEGMLVSDSAVTPRTQVFYFDHEDGEVDMRYSFANMLRGRSDVSISNTLFRFDDQTPFHDEIRLVTPDFAVGKWVSEWSSENALKPFIDDLRRYLPIPTSTETDTLFEKLLHMGSSIRGLRLPREAGISFLAVEQDKNKETRIGLYYILKRIS